MIGRGHSTRRSTAVILTALAAILMVAVSACAELPTSSSPQALGTVQRDVGAADVPTPTPGKEPDLLVRDFLKASSEPGGRHSAARKFLTPAAAKSWDDTTSTSIIDKIDVFFDSRSADEATLLISAAKVGRLDDSGSFRAEEGTLETRVSMVRVDGEWRIDRLPDGVIIDRAQFLNSYHQVQLYFLNPAGTMVVTDPRWLTVRVEELAAQLISMLIEGPNQLLEKSVTTRFGPNVHLRSTLTKLDGRDSNVGVGIGGVKMDFQGIGGLGPRERQQFAAQIVWTLSSAGVAGPYEILADGAPLDPAHADGYTTADVAGFDPSGSATDVGLHAVVDGALVAMTDSGPVPVPGPLGSAKGLVDASLARDGRHVAAVQRAKAPATGVELVVGQYGAATDVAAAGPWMTEPTWAPDGSTWVAVGGDSVQRISVGSNGEPAAEKVDIADVTKIGGDITALRLSQDGVRAALIVDGRVFVAYVTPREKGGYALTSPSAIGSSLSGDAVSLDWGGSEEIGLVRSTPDAPPVIMSFDGFTMHAMSSRNLAPPLTMIQMTPDDVYVVDSRGVMRRSRSAGEDSQYWREVPGLMGEGRLPVVPG
ncbi:MtrAB system accessory lipoprotein LpqB [Tomitella cavernea]|uniref:Lipoprotein LpqB n=1 Tax=Tomitella cavernea TaxID=1387982 RepID=A0ABP9CDA2_9ACTN|nr:MtrAB system accessory lipoprotein LpqB [Tomitella cavernea]